MAKSEILCSGGRNDISRVSTTHIFEPTCNVLFFIIRRPDVLDIADFYFIVFDKSSLVNKSLFVFTKEKSNKILVKLNSM